MPVVPSHLIEPHPEFCFTDGNVVLAAGNGPTLAFRLHRGIINRWSPSFSAKLDALDGDPDPWTYQECGVIVLDDHPLDVERLVSVLYNGTTAVDFSAVKFPRLASVLILSKKYGIQHLYTRALTQLFVAYPITLPEWDAREAYEFDPEARYDRLDVLRTRHAHPIVVVSLALQLGLPHLLIPAYLDLVRFPVSEIIGGYPSSPRLHLPTSQVTAVLRGKETLQRFIADFITTSVENRAPSQECVREDKACATAFARVTHEMLVMTAGVAGGVDSDPLFVLLCSVEMLNKKKTDTLEETVKESEDRVLEVETCAACTVSFKQVVDTARQTVWANLGKWFELKKMLEEGFEAGGWE